MDLFLDCEWIGPCDVRVAVERHLGPFCTQMLVQSADADSRLGSSEYKEGGGRANSS